MGRERQICVPKLDTFFDIIFCLQNLEINGILKLNSNTPFFSNDSHAISKAT